MLRRNGRRKAPRSVPHRTVHDDCGTTTTDDDDDTAPGGEERHQRQSTDPGNNNDGAEEHDCAKQGNSSSSSGSSSSIKRGRSVLGDANENGDGNKQDHRLQQETGEVAGEEDGDASKRRSEDGQGSHGHHSSASGIRATSHLAHTAGAEYGEQAETAERGKEGDRPIEDSTASAAMMPILGGKASSEASTEVQTSRTSSATSAQGSGGSPIDVVSQRGCITTGVESGSNRGSGGDGELYTSSSSSSSYSSSSSSSSCQGLLLEDIELVNLHNLSLHKLEGMEKLVRLRVADLSGNELHDTAPLKSCTCLEVRLCLNRLGCRRMQGFTWYFVCHLTCPGLPPHAELYNVTE